MILMTETREVDMKNLLARGQRLGEIKCSFFLLAVLSLTIFCVKLCTLFV